MTLRTDVVPHSATRRARAIGAHLEAAVDDEVVASGVNFAEAWGRRVVGVWNGVPVILISRDDLIRSKRASGREQDLIDARNLERAGPRKP